VGEVRESFILGMQNIPLESPKLLEKSKSRHNPSISSSDQLNGDDPKQRREGDFLFGSISAAEYKEFPVIKINKRGKRQKRVLAIDGFNIYNIRKEKTKNSRTQ